MKPAPFAYIRPGTLEEALAALAAHGGDAKPLAGGQSLVPAMNFRIAQPSVLVDLNRVPGLDGIERVGAGLRLGGMTRHRTLEHDGEVRAVLPLVSEAMPFVAHPPIRTRGTLGGSLAHADPAAELPALMLALDAVIGVEGRAGRREVAAGEFFLGLYSTALAPEEIVTHVTVPAMRAGAGFAFEEVARRHGDYALAGAAVVLDLDGRGRVAAVRVALLSVHDRPVLAVEAARTLTGEAPTAEAIAAAAEAAARLDIEPSTDIHASSAYRRHLARVMVRRALTRAAARARRPE